MYGYGVRGKEKQRREREGREKCNFTGDNTSEACESVCSNCRALNANARTVLRAAVGSNYGSRLLIDSERPLCTCTQFKAVEPHKFLFRQPNMTQEAAMPPMPSALTFKLVARCSVRLLSSILSYHCCANPLS